ncbi:related to oligosaccharyltransferase delta subunit (ribophorin II) [Cephalotrichum gorgonifer]|uniref:Related to oligosaccharyltransferase delta subunit (Ribophorin II) n=1 Tax=Cephalotrichum gorgonifer TaxID=2041049 RepID=A0AAE8MXC5_9PEZI|nr:related to oligosaccharyltransferase delta subunit (ribophorin II) [Cephalotrichum gorgonifer]
MRFLGSIATLLAAAGTVSAASSWGFADATVSISSKQGSDVLKKLSAKAALSDALELGTGGVLKVSLTAQENGKAARPHQASVVLREEDTGLEVTFPLKVRQSGKGVVDIPYKELPLQHVTSEKPLHASIVIGSFGTAKGLVAPLFDLEVKHDASAAVPKYEKPLRYGKLPEIRHSPPEEKKTPPKVFSLFFLLAVLATVPALFIGWLVLGANVSHLPTALAAAPVSHIAFWASLLAMEGSFVLFYRNWKLLELLPVALGLGVAIWLSGVKALGEVQRRRLAGER